MEAMETLLQTPWILGLLGVPVLLGLLWLIFRNRNHYDDEILVADKELYNRGYFDKKTDYDDPLLDEPGQGQEPVNMPEDNIPLADDRIENWPDDAEIRLEEDQQQETLATETAFHDEVNPPVVEAEPETSAAEISHTQVSADSADKASRTEADEAPEKAPELIIMLGVSAKPGRKFQGQDILEVSEKLGMLHADMQLFHHYGMELKASEKPIFSMANQLKPGVFERDLMSTLHTTGLVLFMQLPGLLDGRVAFELMLHTAQRLAQMLDGNLENERRQTLTAEHIDGIRQEIAQFEQT
ncbi:cell division protein ZipA [Candidatus Venteria ishoeyi]|uniref:Cell division protein ZipA n=1 Tax=Candidatus Venteria ishoeyi TaxID=1899563 RepID=A0A1H6FBY6_9GAMM|nr:cell division protein ZipA [Candidatus Venteria ishoeyi]SEH07610.1 Cell division protein ZipA [Candidatus Venteria ishoeyi]